MGSWLSQNQFRKFNLENSKYTKWGNISLPRNRRTLISCKEWLDAQDDYTKGTQRTQRSHRHHLLQGVGLLHPHLFTFHLSTPSPSSIRPDIISTYVSILLEQTVWLGRQTYKQINKMVRHSVKETEQLQQPTEYVPI